MLDKYPDLLKPKHVAEILRVNNYSIRRWDDNPYIPKSIRIARKNRYDRVWRKSDWVKWLEIN